MKFYTYFSNKQRLALVVLVLLIISLQFSWVAHDNLGTDTFDVHTETYSKFQKEVDSLIENQRQNSVPKIYPFNPNYITDYKGYSIGMNAQEIDRLHAYRSKNKWVNTDREFQLVTKVSDSLKPLPSPPARRSQVSSRAAAASSASSCFSPSSSLNAWSDNPTKKRTWTSHLRVEVVAGLT